MLIRLLCAHEMTKQVCKISHLNSKRLLRKLHKMLGATLFCRTLYIYKFLLMIHIYPVSFPRFDETLVEIHYFLTTQLY